MSQPAEASSPGDGGLGPRGAWAGRTLGHESWKSAPEPNLGSLGVWGDHHSPQGCQVQTINWGNPGR